MHDASMHALLIKVREFMRGYIGRRMACVINGNQRHDEPKYVSMTIVFRADCP